MGIMYDDKSIQKLSSLEWARLRIESNLPNRGLEGLLKLVTEITDNSVDECEQDLSPGNVALIYLFLDKRNNTFQVMVKDNGRGIPHGAVLKSFTEMFTSGKYDRSETAVFKATGGLNGCGSVVVSACSSKFRAMIARENKYTSIHLTNGDINTLVYEQNVPEQYGEHGTTVVFEPDKSLLYDFDKFIEYGYQHIVKLSYLISMFSNKTKFIVRIVDGSINNKFWKLPVQEAYHFIESTYEKKSSLEVDGANEEMTLAYLKELWQLSDNERFLWKLENIKYDFDNVLGYNLSVYLPKTLRSTNAVMLVNNIVITDMSSSPLAVLITCLKDKLAKFIKDEYKDYFLNIYKLPICCAISTKYIDVNFTGLAKSGFKNNAFEKLYLKLLIKHLNTVYEDEWEELYKLIAKDIEVKYLVYYNKPLSKQKANKTSLDIIDPVYFDCKTSDRSQAEIYIVEGVSASHIVNSRDPETQALLMIYGKPKNVLKTGNSGRTPQSIFDNYEVYKRFERILDIHPKQEDLSNAQFSKIILMNDADIDGGHIQALHIGGLWTLNPRIITSGMVYLANPPLYVIKDPTGKKGNKYIQDKNSLIRFFIDCMYRNTFDIFVMDGKAFKEPTKLDNESFTDFCYIITELGELFDHLSAKLAIPPLILEKLTYLTPYLQPGMISGSKLEEALGRGCTYNKYTDILTVIGDKEDYSFALEGVADAFYEELMGYLRSLCWKELQIFVSTKFTNTLNMQRVSIVQLYQMFTSLNNLLNVTRQKGLGGMKKEDLAPLCMRKDTRVLHQITSLGDFERIQSLLGDDVKARKEILKIHGLESSDY